MSLARLTIALACLATYTPRPAAALTTVDSVRIVDADNKLIANVPVPSLERAQGFVNIGGGTLHDNPALDAPLATFESEDRMFVVRVLPTGFQSATTQDLCATMNGSTCIGDGNLYYTTTDCSGTPYIWESSVGMSPSLVESGVVNLPGMTVYVRSGPDVLARAKSWRNAGSHACSSSEIPFVYVDMGQDFKLTPAMPIVNLRDHFRPPFRATTGCQKQCGDPVFARRTVIVGPGGVSADAPGGN